MMLCTWCSIACLIFTVIFVFSAWWQDLEGEWHGHERSDSWRGRPVPSFSPGSDQPDCTVQKRRIRPDRIATARRFFLHQVSFFFKIFLKWTAVWAYTGAFQSWTSSFWVFLLGFISISEFWCFSDHYNPQTDCRELTLTHDVIEESAPLWRTCILHCAPLCNRNKGC